MTFGRKIRTLLELFCQHFLPRNPSASEEWTGWRPSQKIWLCIPVTPEHKASFQGRCLLFIQTTVTTFTFYWKGVLPWALAWGFDFSTSNLTSWGNIGNAAPCVVMAGARRRIMPSPTALSFASIIVWSCGGDGCRYRVSPEWLDKNYRERPAPSEDSVWVWV